MDHDLIIRYVSTLGFPIVAALAMGYAMWKVLSRLVDSHVKFLDKTIAQTEAIQEELPEVCRFGHTVNQRKI